MVQDGGKKKKNKNKKNKNKQNTTNTDQEQGSTSQQHVASPALADQGAVADPMVDESFEMVPNEEPITNTNTTKLEIVNGLFSNSCTNRFDEKTINKNATLKSLALEAKEWMGYDFAAIHDAETKYHIHLAKKQKVNYIPINSFFFLNILLVILNMHKNSESYQI